MMYGQPVIWMAVEILFLPIIWGIVGGLLLSIRKQECFVNGALFIAALYAIFRYTILNRTAGIRNVVFVPLQLLWEAISQNKEIVRSILLNIFLFEPFGAAFVNLLPQRTAVWKKILMVSVTGLVICVGVEASQYGLYLGNFEADDVICNTLGTFIGALSLPMKTAIATARNVKKEI